MAIANTDNNIMDTATIVVVVMLALQYWKDNAFESRESSENNDDKNEKWQMACL